MTSHFFYVGSTDSDYKRNIGKGGETEEPYMRLKRYGTSAQKDNQFRFRFLAQLATIDKQLIRKVEKRWLSKFDDVPSESEDDDDLNHASTVEGIAYTKVGDFLTFFMETLRELRVEDLFLHSYSTNEEINLVLHHYKSLQIKSRSIQSSSGLPLRPYQIEDIQKTLHAFLEEGVQRGWWSIECGLGKTVMAYELIRQINPRRCFFIVPRNTLLHQVLQSFLEWKYPRQQLYYCSSSPLPSHIGCLGKVRQFKDLPTDTPFLCVITYDSLPSMTGGQVELLIFDEGHHLVPSAKKIDLSGNLFGLDDSNLKSKYRLTITATPKNTPLVENDIVSHIGMSHQPQLYGTCLAERNYIFGRSHGYLANFEIVCIKTESQLIRSMIQRFKTLLHLEDSIFVEFLAELKKWEEGRSRAMLDHIDPTIEPGIQDGEEDTYSGELILWYAIVAELLIQSIARFNCKKIVVYHTTKKRAELFQKIIMILWKQTGVSQSITCDTVHSGNSNELNEQAKTLFKAKEGADIRILCNIRTLIEGFDEPSIDTTVFADNKWSAIECKQILGRGNRIDPQNPMKVHKVLVPFLAYETQETEEMAFIRTTNDYKTVRYTVKNIILSHDPNQSISQTVWVPKLTGTPNLDENTDADAETVDLTEKLYIPEEVVSSHDQAILGSCPTDDLAAQSFQQSRQWMHELARCLEWGRLLTESQITSAWNRYKEFHVLPKDIPYDPSKIYRQVGWIHWRDYVGLLTKREEWQELHAGEMLDLLRSKRINLFDHTLSSLRTQIESILTRKLPASPRSKWKLSLYDVAERAHPGSTEDVRKWGKYTDKLYKTLAKEGVSDAIDFERLWPSLHKTYPTMPGIPSEIWDDRFWTKYDSTEQ
jgi:superfamily II DNA or RNA helicase